MVHNGYPLRGQPDLHRFSRGHRIIAEESEKLSNLPAINGGNALAVAIQELTRELREGFASIRTQMRIIDRNSAARVQNSYVTSPTEPLSPFMSLETGEPIDGFPVTSAEIRQMALQQLNEILRALALGTHGARAVKESRLREYIGLRRYPQQVA